MLLGDFVEKKICSNPARRHFEPSPMQHQKQKVSKDQKTNDIFDILFASHAYF
jgi:hypothetical protein